MLDLEECSVKEVVIGHKNVFNKALFGIVNRGGVVPVNNNFSVRFVLLNNDFVSLQIVTHSKDDAPKQQFHRVKKEKVIIEKPVQKDFTEFVETTKTEKAW